MHRIGPLWAAENRHFAGCLHKDLAHRGGIHRLELLLKLKLRLATICAVQTQIQLLQQKRCHLAVKSFVSVQLHNCHCLSYLVIVLAMAPDMQKCVIEITVHAYFQYLIAHLHCNKPSC